MPTKKTPLNISCTATDCASDLHCFKDKKSGEHPAGTCRQCGANLVAWDRVHQRDLNDVANTFAALKHELIRHHFWHVEIDQRALNHARRKGRKRLYADIDKRITTSIGKAEPYHDGYQTPKEGNTIYYAQHATASCCRRCAEYWHGIPTGRSLTAEEITYLSDLVRLYLDERLPDLVDGGVKVPPIRSAKASTSDKVPANEQTAEPLVKPQRLSGRVVEKRQTTADRPLEAPNRSSPPRREPETT